jgi:putative phage-type endonuclease
MQVIDVEQGTDAWREIRSGKVTASRFSDVSNVLKDGKDGAARRNLKAQLIAEILSGKPCESTFFSPAMQRGQELEPLARAAYEIRTGEMVDLVGFVQHPSIERAGCSPDGAVGADGLLECKCPLIATHIEYMLKKEVPAEYRGQLVWQLACTGREWVDLCSYCPELPEHLQLFIVRMVADRSAIESAESKVRQFLAECDQLLAQLETRVIA